MIQLPRKFVKSLPIILPALAVILFAANYLLLQKLGGRHRDRVVTTFVPKPVQHDLIPDDPQRYNFIENPLEGSLAEGPQVSRHMQAFQSFEKIPLNREELQHKIKLIDRQIKQAERAARATTPPDERMKENLETLYTLRAMLLNLSTVR